jgi:hypothetical protein
MDNLLNYTLCIANYLEELNRQLDIIDFLIINVIIIVNVISRYRFFIK